MKKLLLAVLIFTALWSNAQTAVGASGAFNVFSKNRGQFISFGPLMEFGIKEKYSARLSFQFFVPKTLSGTTVGYYMGNAANGQAVNVTYTNKYRIMTFALDVKRYIRELDGNKVGGFYAGGGLGLIFENLKTTYSPYDSQNYYIRAANASTSYSQLMFRGFFGSEIIYKSSLFFIETQVIAPTNSTNAEGAGIIEVPVYLAFQLGCKYFIRK